MLCPEKNCALCPRLVAFRKENQQKFPTFYNAPVPSFGPLSAKLLVLGMAPGLKGANQTGRPFTNDYAGDLLYPVLKQFGLAKGSYGRRADDGFELIDTRVTNAVRCVPPQNKVIAAEASACRPFFAGGAERAERAQSGAGVGLCGAQRPIGGARMQTVGIQICPLRQACSGKRAGACRLLPHFAL